MGKFPVLSLPALVDLVLCTLVGAATALRWVKKPGALKGALWSSNPANQGAQR